MFLTDKKLENRMIELEGYRYRDSISLEEFAVKEDTQGVTNPTVPVDFTDWNTLKLGDTWKGRNLYLWMHRQITIPESMKGKRVVGVFDFGNTGAGNNSGFESMLYLNEKPYQGVDVNHKEVFFKDDLCGKTINLTFRLWSGLEGGGKPVPQEHKIARAELAWLDEKVDHFYYMGTMIVDTLKQLGNENPIKYQLQNALDQASRLIEWWEPGSDAFYNSIHEAEENLQKELEKIGKHSDVTVKCIGHTHIDVAWLWQLKHTREKASRSFSTVLRLMEDYPDYLFLQTQPQLYEYIKEDFPEIYEKIKEKVADGQWEIDGGMWVEADCNLTSGESLTRQILIGSKFIQDEFGKDISYLWLPDVFGYSWALPQILQKSGIKTFMTTKISWNQYNRMPHDTFYWKGIDGSEILTHFITTPDPWSEPGSWFYTYNGKITAKTVKGVWDAYSEKEWNNELLISYGYGDGGGGVNRDMLEQRRCIDQIPGLPNLKTATAKEFFEDLHETAETTNGFLHTWDGELYLEYHRGTYTSHAYNKRMNRKMEQMYRRAEWLTVMNALQHGTKGDSAEKVLDMARQERLTQGWKNILTEQFHDIIPGSSIKEVYEDSVKDYDRIQAIAEEVEQEFFSQSIEESENTYTILNTAAFKRTDIAEIEESAEGCFTDESGNELLSQKINGKVLVQVPSIPSMGTKHIVFHAGKKAAEDMPFAVTDKKIETPFYSMTLNAFGQIESLYDKECDREVLAAGERGNVLQMFEDKPLGNDAWDIDIFYQQKVQEVTNLTKCEVTEIGSLRMVMHLEYRYGKSEICQDMTLYANSKRIDFKTHVDCHEQHQLLKAAFPVDIRSTYATYDIQYGNVRRPNHWNTSWDQARFESVAHRFADLSEHNYGVSLLNDCKYGYDIKDNVLRISLIKTATHPDYMQDQGEHDFTYSLLPHQGDFIEGNTVQEAFALNEQLVVAKGKSKLGFDSFISFDTDNVELDAIKKSEDGKYLVIRFHEFTGSRKQIQVKLGFEYAAWMESDLRERPIEEPRVGSITMSVKPYEIKTILIQL